MGNEKTLKRQETEIFDQSYKMWAEGTNAKFCIQPAILQNTCYVPLFLEL